MELIYLGILIIIIPILIWIALKVTYRSIKRNAYGKLILSVKDHTYAIDILAGVIFLLLGGKNLIVVFIDGETLITPGSYLMMFSLCSIIYFVRATFRIEIRENGILSKKSGWTWEEVESSYIKETNSSVVITFKFKNSRKKPTSIMVHKKDRMEVERKLEEIFTKK
ncbi:DUF5673 domain-containing protein [Clostridium sp. 'White wine YQ']|uniref:DUF5673 domain-containing protein n=1 Tax=Clostridium sp. 'White wine YQ' TaxID=3027474 RepID=UPI002366CF86|nr:DUF5673 domain-containing protein [Clostridium sp. 'White wine YQ']MDD7793067.1 DUF5673 domain-containing protein [Clostridium sp. 'White wine YQ']